ERPFSHRSKSGRLSRHLRTQGEFMLRNFALFSRLVLLIGCTVSISIGVFAQSQANSGNIEGRVLDPNGAAVAGATVSATNQQTGLEKSATTNDEGDFSIILLPPGVYSVRTNAGGSAQSAINDVTVTVGSHTPLEVKLSVGDAAATVTISESVQEFQVNQNGFSAEFGRAGGAVINVVTKSGTNQFHGGAFEYFRDEALNANDPLVKANQFRAGQPNRRAKLQINQFGGRVGGPIKQNRAFFFFTYDGQRANVPQVMDVPNIGAAPAAAQSGLLPKIHTYAIGRKQDVFLGKSDIKVNDRNQLVFRFNHQGFNGKNNENNGTLSAEEHSGDSRVKSD